MSGLSKEKHQSGAYKFVNFKEGELVANIDGVKDSFSSITGLVKEMDVTDEVYKNKAYKKITLFIIDDDGSEYRLGFPLESGYGNAFCSIVPNINFDLPVTISGGMEDKEDGKKYSKLFVKQLGKNLKWYYTKDNEAGKKLPQGEKKSDRNGDYTDFTKRNKFFFELLVEPKKGIRTRIKKAWPNYEISKAATTNNDAANITAPIDDLPF